MCVGLKHTGSAALVCFHLSNPDLLSSQANTQRSWPNATVSVEKKRPKCAKTAAEAPVVVCVLIWKTECFLGKKKKTHSKTFQLESYVFASAWSNALPYMLRSQRKQVCLIVGYFAVLCIMGAHTVQLTKAQSLIRLISMNFEHNTEFGTTAIGGKPESFLYLIYEWRRWKPSGELFSTFSTRLCFFLPLRPWVVSVCLSGSAVQCCEGEPSSKWPRFPVMWF